MLDIDDLVKELKNRAFFLLQVIYVMIMISFFIYGMHFADKSAMYISMIGIVLWIGIQIYALIRRRNNGSRNR